MSKRLLIYDSLFGNTEKVAKEIAKASKAEIISRGKVTLSDLKNIELLIVGSPTQAGKAKPDLQLFLTSIPDGSLKGTKVAAFDTRFSFETSSAFLKLILKVFGFAAPKILKLLEGKGGTPVGTPEGFIVTAEEGPLKEGELARAASWAKSLK
jgi:flavodoxin I